MHKAAFYLDHLYPLQDKVLRFLATREILPVYLTGGTALSRGYCQHRFSDDLEFFTTEEVTDFRKRIGLLTAALYTAMFKVEITSVSDHFCRLFVHEGDVSLKIDFINDVLPRSGDLVQKDFFPAVDNVFNILSNKVTALPRHEAKDIADLWAVARHSSFDWRVVLRDADRKSPVDPLDVAHTIRLMPSDALTQIKWLPQMDTTRIANDLLQIAQDVLLGRSNSLFP